jgi:hypothetical protein
VAGVGGATAGIGIGGFGTGNNGTGFGSGNNGAGFGSGNNGTSLGGGNNGTGLAGLNSANVGAAYASMEPAEQRRLLRRCATVLKQPSQYDRETRAVCRVVAAK